MTAYKPMVDFAKEQGIPVLTGNIPRRMAAAYAKAGSLNGIAEADRLYLPKVHKAGSEAYRAKFAATMAAMNDMPGGMKVPEAMVQPMFMAQCLKGRRHGRKHSGLSEYSWRRRRVSCRR